MSCRIDGRQAHQMLLRSDALFLVCRYANGGHPAGLHTTALGAGPEVYNNMAASHNCVGGSEQGCIPEHPPVADPSKTGMGSSLPPPASW